MNQETKQVLLNLGKAQIDAMFFRQDSYPIDDSEFIPLLEVVIDAFAKSALESEGLDELWDYAYKRYDQSCREADPNYSFEENIELMHSFLIGPRKKE